MPFSNLEEGVSTIVFHGGAMFPPISPLLLPSLSPQGQAPGPGN